MLIRDLEKETGMDRGTIRFYEREGFLSPQRKENGYREYTQSDLDQLKKIRLLRQLGLSLETIKDLQQGTDSMHRALSVQMQSLDQQIQNAGCAKSVCAAIRDANTSYASLDADYYLRQLNRPAQLQSSSQERETGKVDYRENVYRPYHPVRRYLARITDYTIVRVAVVFLLVVVFRIRPFSSFWSNLLTYCIPFLLMPVEAAMLSWWGTTPGKWLFGLGVRTENGDALSFEDAIEREKMVLKDGYGYGIPIWSVYRLYKSYMQYGDVELDWDRECEYQYHSWRFKRVAALVTAIALLFGMSIWSAADSIKPKHRGDLNIAQFAENYNYYMQLVYSDADSTALLRSDGTHQKPARNTMVVYTEGTPVTEDMNFDYAMENGRIRSIHYESSWTNVTIMSPKSRPCKIAAITLLLAQQGIGQRKLLEFSKLLDGADYCNDGKIVYENIEVSWNVISENCKIASGWIMESDDTQPSFVSFIYDIKICN